METKNLVLVVTTVMTIASVSGFAQQDKKSEKARKDVAESHVKLKEAQTDSTADYQQFKKNAEEKIRDNEKKIAKLKIEKSKNDKETKEEYDKKVLALEAKNNELKKRIADSANTKTYMWSSFKREFTHDMDELANAFKDIGIDNAK
jgi:hypothetical protein